MSKTNDTSYDVAATSERELTEAELDFVAGGTPPNPLRVLRGWVGVWVWRPAQGLLAQRAVLSGVRRAIPRFYQRRTVMTGNAIKSEALELRKLSSEELDAVSGGLLFALLQMPDVHQYINGDQQPGGGSIEGGGGQNDPAQMFQQIMQQLTQG